MMARVFSTAGNANNCCIDDDGLFPILIALGITIMILICLGLVFRCQCIRNNDPNIPMNIILPEREVNDGKS